LPCEDVFDESEDACDPPAAKTGNSQGAAGLLLVEQFPAGSCLECPAGAGGTC
jgi:hypothetical protein